MERAPYSYEFEGFRFTPDERLLVRVRDDHPFSLMPKESGLLLVLIKGNREIVLYDQIKKEVWPESPHVLVHTIRETKHTLSKILGDTASKIETVAGKGYRLNVVVTEKLDQGATRADAKSSEPASGSKRLAEREAGDVQNWPDVTLQSTASAQLSRPFAGHIWHVIMSCTLYALLYSIAPLVEVAYQFDRLGATALKVVLLTFLWIISTSVAGLFADWKWVRQEKTKGLFLSLTIFTCAGLGIYFALGMFLPRVPITEANFQTYTAQGAYLKSVCYFLFLAIVFLLVPFHFVLAAQREMQVGSPHSVLKLLKGERGAVAPGDAIYLRVWWLGLVLLIAAFLSPILAAHLFDNLKPNSYMNLFMQLVEWRILLYLLLGLECSSWYYRSLNRIRGAGFRTCNE
jgi:DNA-binding winged helix-turn-helix (wHTH) protein